MILVLITIKWSAQIFVIVEQLPKHVEDMNKFMDSRCCSPILPTFVEGCDMEGNN
jgi:hypothetical protein